jgi:hypothetical protein
MRRVRTKSRLGCKECKARRIKCDELRPACTKCLQIGRCCSYARESAVLPPKAVTFSSRATSDSCGAVAKLPNSEPEASTLWPLPSILTRAGTRYCESSDPSLIKEYSLIHLRLLYHFEHELGEHMKSTHGGLNELLGLFITQAFEVPYLMHGILAYAAAHKSTIDPETQAYYASEATQLQTTALSLYNNTKPQLSEATCLPMFIFASLLGQQILFDLFAGSKENLGAVLDALTCSVSVHRGLSAIARSSWPIFSESVQRQFTKACLRDARSTSIKSRGECDNLLARLKNCDLSPAATQVHCEAVKILQNLLDEQSYDPECNRNIIVAVQEWLIRVPAEYVQFLNQRRPEALAVLAHYAILLHRAANYWFLQNTGKRLILLITSHLGPFWVDWLEWPNQVIQMGPAG